MISPSDQVCAVSEWGPGALGTRKHAHENRGLCQTCSENRGTYELRPRARPSSMHVIEAPPMGRVVQSRKSCCWRRPRPHWIRRRAVEVGRGKTVPVTDGATGPTGSRWTGAKRGQLKERVRRLLRCQHLSSACANRNGLTRRDCAGWGSGK